MEWCCRAAPEYRKAKPKEVGLLQKYVESRLAKAMPIAQLLALRGAAGLVEGVHRTRSLNDLLDER
jgi:hypothetical protein